MRIIPAIDVIGGKCVRLTQGDYQQKKVYNEDPVEVAKMFEDAGLKFLHLVDLDGAKAGAVTNWSVVEKVVRKTTLAVDFGGGIKTRDELTRLLDIGVKQVNLGSIVVKNRPVVSEWIQEFGEKIILSADVLNNQVKVNGWQESSSFGINTLIDAYIPYGLKNITCTDISKDGMLEGPNVELYRSLVAAYPSVAVVASGGIATIEDLEVLEGVGVDGVIVGKAIYEKRISVDDLTKF